MKECAIYRLGAHRLMCGDATRAQDVRALMCGDAFDLCFTSPPYGSQRIYASSSVLPWHQVMCRTFDHMLSYGSPDCHLLINLGLSHSHRQVDLCFFAWLEYCASVGWPLFGWYVWDKGSGLPGEWGGRLAPAHEFIFHFNRKRSYPNKWIKSTGRLGGRRLALRDKYGKIHESDSPHLFGQAYKIPDSVIRLNRENGRNDYGDHPAVFPVILPEFIMMTYSQPGEIVYEPFCGSGSSLLAAEHTGRRCYAMEIDPSYCQLAIHRWQHETMQEVVQIL